MSSTNRHHTLIVNERPAGGYFITLEKDWWNYEFAQAWDRRMNIDRPQGTFHLVGQSFVLSPLEAGDIVDRVIRGEIQTINLREMSVKHFPTAEEKRLKK